MGRGAFALTDNDCRRLSRALQRIESEPYGDEEPGYQDTGNDGNFDDWVLTTSGTATGGWYPAKVQTYSEATNTWTDVAGTVYIRGPNGETLTNATRYRGNIVDQHSGASAYQAVGVGSGGGGGSLTVAEVDGSPSVGSVTTINFDSTDGLTVTDSGGGVARIDLLPATKTQAGGISLSGQVMGDGTKTFSDGIVVNNDRTGSIAALSILAAVGNIVLDVNADSAAGSGRVTVGSTSFTGTTSLIVYGPAYAQYGMTFGLNISGGSQTRSQVITAINPLSTATVAAVTYRENSEGILEVGIAQSVAIRPGMKVRMDITGGGFGYVEAQTRFQLGAPTSGAGIGSNADVVISAGLTLHFRGGIFTGIN